MEYADVPEDVLTRLRAVSLALPETHEQQAWVGRRWMIRKRTFAHVFTIDQPRGPVTMVQFRCQGEERDILIGIGRPYFEGGWGHDVLNMVLDDDTDWSEMGELLTDSYCIQAPKKLAALVVPPEP